jgi:hypothetical protein
MGKFNDLLVIVGLSTIAVMIFFIIASIIMLIKNLIIYLKESYVYKHRFTRPTANCYCRDCKFWSNGVCYFRSGWRTGDAEFCNRAEILPSLLKENKNE